MTNDELMQTGKEYIMNTYGRFPIALEKGQGSKVWDIEGKEYIDFTTGLAVTSLGHAHPAVVKAISEQCSRIIHSSNLYWIKPQIELAELLVENSDFDKVFFANSGAEVNEGAIKLARKHNKLKYCSDRYEIITMEQSFHGRTMATLTATGQEKFHKGFEPLLEGFKYVPFNDFEALAKAISDRTCAVMLELIQGEGGVRPADKQYIKKVEKLCQEKDLLLIVDEVQSGIGRTGTMFAYQSYNIKPQIMTLAKALGNGTAIGALLAVDEVAQSFQPGDHASTFGGNFVACAAAKAVIETMINEELPARALGSGKYLINSLEKLKGEFPEIIEEVRGLGLLVGIEVKCESIPLVKKAMENGLLLSAAGARVVRFLPPLNVDKQIIDEAVDIFKGVLAAGKEDKNET